MKKKFWTSSDIRKLYRMDERYKTIQTLYNAEARGDIPKAQRIPRGTKGRIFARNWTLEQIPEIGRKFGFLPQPSKQKILCKYIQKGGVLKTTTSFNEAKTFALNGIKTLIVGQDFECSITDAILPKEEISKLEDTKQRLGLYHFFAENAPIEEIISKTPLPTLDLIPETHDLVALDRWLSQQNRREYIYSDKLIPLLKDYQVIIFDNGPSWNHLIENAIVCSHAVLSPLGCNLLAYNASQTNLATIFEFQKVMSLKKQKVIMFSTLLERTSLSQQINAQYLTKFSDYIIPIPIRKSVKGEEAILQQKTILEYAPTTSLAEEYYHLIKSIWKEVTKEEKKTDRRQTPEELTEAQ